MMLFGRQVGHPVLILYSSLIASIPRGYEKDLSGKADMCISLIRAN